MAMEIDVADMPAASTPTPEAATNAATIINGDGSESGLVASTFTSDSQGVELEPEQTASTLVDSASDASESTTSTLDAPELSDEEIAAQRLVAEENWKAEMDSVKEEMAELALKRSAAEVDLKELKASEKAALKSLRALIARGPSYPEIKTAQQAKIDAAVANDKETPSAIVVDDANADVTWKAIPTKDVIGDGIKGMGDKKLEAILDLAPTLGDLEELRAAASKACKPFGSVLPKGVGRGMADEIEERCMNAIAKHCANIKAAKEAAAATTLDANESFDNLKLHSEDDVQYEDVEDGEPEPVSLDDI
jgi:hypothetical protein